MNPVRGLCGGLCDWCGELARDWDRFWFTPAESRRLGLLRWLVGGMLLYTHFVWGLKLESFFGPYGFESLEAVRALRENDYAVSFWWWVPAEHIRHVHTLAYIPLLLFWFGLKTRITSVAALCVLISNSNRAPTANYGMDQILSILTFYLVIGDSGGSYSIDSLLRARRGSTVSNSTTTVASGLAIRLIQVHYCLIYVVAGTSKLQGEAWWNGEALWMTIANAEYQSGNLLWLARFPWLLELLTHLIVAWEISFPFLVGKPRLRPVVLLIGTLMHLGIGAFLGMWTFGLTMIFGYLAFLPGEAPSAAVIKR